MTSLEVAVTEAKLMLTCGPGGVGKTTTASVMFMTLTVLILDALFPPIFLD